VRPGHGRRGIHHLNPALTLCDGYTLTDSLKLNEFAGSVMTARCVRIDRSFAVPTRYRFTQPSFS
jgi:hypothetical protein